MVTHWGDHRRSVVPEDSPRRAAGDLVASGGTAVDPAACLLQPVGKALRKAWVDHLQSSENALLLAFADSQYG